MSITKHDSPLADNAASITTPQTIDETTRSLHAARISVAGLFFPGATDIDVTLYSPAILRCIYDLYKDHRGTVSAKAWITS